MSIREFSAAFAEEMLVLGRRRQNLVDYEKEVQELKEMWETQQDVDPDLAIVREDNYLQAIERIEREKEVISERFYHLITFVNFFNGRRPR